MTSSYTPTSTHTPYVSQGDKKSFVFFCLLIIGTAAQFLFPIQTPILMGLLSIIWGAFGLFRLIYLTHYQMDEVPKMFVLPVQILFGTGTKEQERRRLVIRRLTRPDFILWLGSAILFILWAMFNGLSPNSIYLNEAFGHIVQIKGGALPVPSGISPYAILTNLSYFGALTTLIFITVTFSYNRDYVNATLFVLMPLIVLGVFIILFMGNYAQPILWPDILYLKGAGLRDSQTEFLLGSFDMTASQTSFLQRFLELGSVGAYGLYMVGLAPLVLLLKTLFSPHRHRLKPMIGVLALILLAVIDIVIIFSIWTTFLSVLLITVVAITWGHTIRYK